MCCFVNRACTIGQEFGGQVHVSSSFFITFVSRTHNLQDGVNPVYNIARVCDRRSCVGSNGPCGGVVHTAHHEQGAMGRFLYRSWCCHFRFALFGTCRSGTVDCDRFHRSQPEPIANSWQHRVAGVCYLFATAQSRAYIAEIKREKE